METADDYDVWDVPGVGQRIKDKLFRAGYSDIRTLAGEQPGHLSKESDIKEKTAIHIIEWAREILGNEKKR